jgi:hypothetical protein
MDFRVDANDPQMLVVVDGQTKYQGPHSLFVPEAIPLTLMGVRELRVSMNNDFEPGQGYQMGILTGQNGAYIPQGTQSTDWKIFSYANNPWGLQPPPGSFKTQFAAGSALDPQTAARAQWNIAGAEELPDLAILLRFAALHTAPPPANNNLGSMSGQPGSTFTQLAMWPNPNDDLHYAIVYNVYDPNGNPLNNQSPGPAWQNLHTGNNWYQTEMVVSHNKIQQVSITDMATGIKTTANVNGWLLRGTTLDSRIFAGGDQFNVMAVDTFAWWWLPPPKPGRCEADCDQSGSLDFFDWMCVQNQFADGDMNADFDGDGELTSGDFAAFQALFAAGCP